MQRSLERSRGTAKPGGIALQTSGLHPEQDPRCTLLQLFCSNWHTLAYATYRSNPEWRRSMPEYCKPVATTHEVLTLDSLQKKKPSISERVIEITYIDAMGRRRMASVRESGVADVLGRQIYRC